MLKLEEHLPFEFIAVFAQGIIWSHIIACKKKTLVRTFVVRPQDNPFCLSLLGTQIVAIEH